MLGSHFSTINKSLWKSGVYNLQSHRNCDRPHGQRSATQSFRRLRLQYPKQRWESFRKRLPDTYTDRLVEGIYTMQAGGYAQGCQPGDSYLRTCRATGHKMPQAGAVRTLVPSPLGEERKAVIERYGSAVNVPGYRGVCSGGTI